MDYEIPRENITIFVDDKRKFEACRTIYKMKPDVNLFYIDTEKTLRENGLYTTKGEIMKKFDVVIMNPPYQVSDGGGGEFGSSAVPIYHKFIEKIIDYLQPEYLVSINPSRWMVGGRGLDNFRKRMINDKRILKIVHFPCNKKIFPDVTIKGGVNYFLWDKKYNGKCEFIVGNTSTKRFLNEYDIVIQDNNAISILEKVRIFTQEWISQKCISQKPFGLRSKFSDWSPDGTACYSIGKNVHNVAPNAFTDRNKIIGKWKVCTSAGTSGVNPDKTGALKIISNFFLIEPNAICTETYIVVNVFNVQNEAENFITYMGTKFFRFMLGLRLLIQLVSKEKFAWVPDLGDYTKPWTDVELYDKFNLTEQERGYIESKIKTLTKVDKNDI